MLAVAAVGVVVAPSFRLNTMSLSMRVCTNNKFFFVVFLFRFALLRLHA